MWSDVKLPVVTSSERVTFKRCQKKWYWMWRRGLVARAKQFGALDLGNWMHDGLAAWYGKGRKREGSLMQWVTVYAQEALNQASVDGAPDYIIEAAEPMMMLAIHMAESYEDFYGKDDKIFVVRAEIPLEFTIPNRDGIILAKHKLKPDLVFIDQYGQIWLMEHKTAKQVSTAHLVLDDQARPYGAMSEPALRDAGIIRPDRRFAGIMYNYLRKALVDQRPTNSKGQYLNKNGSVSKSQPPPYFIRHPVKMTRKAKMRTLSRVRDETLEITEMTLRLRTGDMHPDRLNKTPHKSCAKLCPFFTMCVAEEEGSNVRNMEHDMFVRKNPYAYHDSTEELQTFEMVA